MDIGPSNCFTWDGRDDSGALCQEGEYSFDIVALDGKDISIEKTVTGVVSGIARNPDSPCGYKVIMEDGSSIDPENIESFVSSNNLKDYMQYVGKAVGIYNTIDVANMGYVEPKEFSNNLSNTGRARVTYYNKYDEEVGYSIIFNPKHGKNILQDVQAYACEWSDLACFETKKDFLEARKEGKLKILPQGTYTYSVAIEDKTQESSEGGYEMQTLQEQLLYEGILGVHSDDSGQIEFLTSSGNPIKLDQIKSVIDNTNKRSAQEPKAIQDPKSYMGMYVDYVRQFLYSPEKQEYNITGLQNCKIDYPSEYTPIKYNGQNSENQVTVKIFRRNHDGSSGEEIGSCKGYFQANKTYKDLVDDNQETATAKVREYFAYSEYDYGLNTADSFATYYNLNKEKVDAFVAKQYRAGKLEDNPDLDAVRSRQSIKFDTSTFTGSKENSQLTEGDYNIIICPSVTDSSGSEIANVTGIISTRVQSVYNDGNLGLENSEAINPLAILNAKSK